MTAIKLCDPGQALRFDLDPDGRELPVSFYSVHLKYTCARLTRQPR